MKCTPATPLPTTPTHPQVLASPELAPLLSDALAHARAAAGASSTVAAGAPPPPRVRAVFWAPPQAGPAAAATAARGAEPQAGRGAGGGDPADAAGAAAAALPEEFAVQGVEGRPWPAPMADAAERARFNLEEGASEEDGFHLYYTRWNVCRNDL